MGSRERGLVVLGNNITALSIVRAAHKMGLRCVLFDHEPGVAFYTWLAKKVLSPRGDERENLVQLTALSDTREMYLIAVSDAWVDFIVRHREQLDASFGRVLHASNDALRTCLDKEEFARFCRQHGLSSPHFYDGPADEHDESIVFPVIVRPARSAGASGAGLPKAQHVKNEAELSTYRRRFDDAKVPCVVSESLLDQRLVKYSVPVARSGGGIMSYVAEQARPFPEDCAVGTYVRLQPNHEAEALARRAAELLDYHGIGECEILYSQDSGRYYLIEFNVRPWLQYSLAEASNHHMLHFVLEPEAVQAGCQRKTGESWLWLEADLYVCFSRTLGYVRRERIGWVEYIRSLTTASTGPLLYWRDPRPALHRLRQTFGMLAPKLFRFCFDAIRPTREKSGVAEHDRSR